MFVLNVIDGCIPSDMAVATREQVEEERLSPYVAMTRARQDLHLMHRCASSAAISIGMAMATF